MRRLFVIGLGIYFALFIFNSLTRTRQFSPDSMNYVDVARNMASGRGLSQSTMGFNQPILALDKGFPVPFTAQAPLYPMLVAFLSKLGLSSEDAALVVPGVGYAVALLLLALVVRRLAPGDAWYYSAGFMLLAAPMRMIGRCAWSESISISIMLFAILCILKIREEPEKKNGGICFLAGLLAGSAFATRYAFGIFPLLGVLFFLVERRSQRDHLFKLGFYLLGSILPFASVLLHNHNVSGLWMPKALKSDQSFTINLQDALLSVCGSWFNERSFQAEQVVILCLGLGLSFLYIFFRKKSLEFIKELFLGQGRYLLSFWAVLYLGFIVVQRTTQHFDQIGTRLMLPVIIVGMIILSHLIVEIIRVAGWKTSGRPFLVVMMLIACGLEVFVLVSRRPYDKAAQGFSSERLNWISSQTTEKDLIIGDNAVDIPFYLKRPAAISFSPFPYSTHFSYETLQDVVDRFSNSHPRIFLVLRRSNLSEEQQKYFFGDFIRDLRVRKVEAYRGVVLVQELRDCLVYLVTPAVGQKGLP